MQDFDERYLCVYLANSKHIKDYLDFYNFYAEIAKLPFKSKNKQMFIIKLKWMLDGLDSVDNTGYPPLDKIKILFNKYNIPPCKIRNIIQTKMIDLDEFPFAKHEDVLNYAVNTGGEFWEIAQLFIDKNILQNKMNNIKNAGIAFALIGLVRNAWINYKYHRFTLVYKNQTPNQESNLNDLMQNNIKQIISNATQLISNNQKKYNSASQYLNIFTKHFINNINRANYNALNQNINTISKATYLKIFLCFVKNKLTMRH